MVEQKYQVLATLGISPELYYDLTGMETNALLKGATNRELAEMRRTRIVATLLRNAHFQNPQTEMEYMPLPGDEQYKAQPTQSPEAMLAALAGAMGATITIEER